MRTGSVSNCPKLSSGRLDEGGNVWPPRNQLKIRNLGQCQVRILVSGENLPKKVLVLRAMEC